MKPTDYNGWQDMQTLQFKEIMSELTDAKEEQRAKLIISDTGCGKSNTIKMFKRKFSEHTYVITVGDSYKLVDIVDELMSLLRIDFAAKSKNHIHRKLKAIAVKLREVYEMGGKPMIILDEAENTKPAVLKTIKELYDAVIDYCSIVLIGTDQILDSLLNRKHKNRMSVPQLWRRFKAGTRYVNQINKARDFKPFFDKYIPGNIGVQDILLEKCENYGELHDYLHPVLIDCGKKNRPLTEEVFRFYHKIPVRKGLSRA
jgi:DNA transposition AAA+ family ATPase